jgi:RecA-family ATPase
MNGALPSWLDDAPDPSMPPEYASDVRIKTLGWPEIAAPLPELEYVVPELGMVAGGGAPHLIAGYGYSGKSLAAQAMLLALAAEKPVWGAYKTKPRRMLHVDMEQGERLTRARYQRLARAMGVDEGHVEDRLRLVCFPALILNRDNATAWKDLLTGYDFAIIDSLRAASGVMDENDSRIRGGLDMLGELSESTKCRACLIHHARKVGADDPGGRYAIRGSSAIFDGVDSAHLFSASKGEPVSVEQVKARSHGEPVDDFALVISDVAGPNRDPKWGVRVQIHGKELVEERREATATAKAEATALADARKVMAHLQKVQPQWPNYSELRGALHISGDRLYAALATLKGKVVKEKVMTGKGGSQPVIYKLS